MLRYATAADAPALFELGADAEVTRFFSWGPYTSADEPPTYIARLAGERERSPLAHEPVDVVGEPPAAFRC